MSNLFTMNIAQSMIRHATGETYGDGMMVSEIGIGYAEPGYHDSETVWALGNWNPRKWNSDDPADNVAPALAQALERAGVEIEWSDEWEECRECFRIVRTQADSYSWTASHAWLEDVGTVCHDCLDSKYGEDALTDFVNDAHRAVTFFDAAKLESFGYVKHNPDSYENGWHPGQNDSPTAILDGILETAPDAQVVFLIDSAGQFDVAFSAYVKTAQEG